MNRPTSSDLLRLACFAWMAMAWQTTLKVIKACETESLTTLESRQTMLITFAFTFASTYIVLYEQANKFRLAQTCLFCLDGDGLADYS